MALAAAQEKQAPPATKAETPADSPASEYAGSETCAACHEDIAKAFSRNRHAVVKDRKVGGETERACEACHGPGAKHAESTEAAQIVKPVKSDSTCLSCHRGPASHNWRALSGHARAGVNCASCHSIHAAPVASAPRAVAINQKCGACHPAALAAFQRPHTHRLKQGAMSCVDCHAPHGGPYAPSLASTAAQERACLKCHGDKRGPFAFEHAPVRLEGCSACHEPHGSGNPRMLTRAEPNRQCLECHASLAGSGGGKPELGGVPPAFHDLRSARYRNCTVCHTRIHGSNVNRSLLR